jgi:hypothetical protein
MLRNDYICSRTRSGSLTVEDYESLAKASVGYSVRDIKAVVNSFGLHTFKLIKIHFLRSELFH